MSNSVFSKTFVCLECFRRNSCTLVFCFLFPGRRSKISTKHNTGWEINCPYPSVAGWKEQLLFSHRTVGRSWKIVWAKFCRKNESAFYLNRWVWSAASQMKRASYSGHSYGRDNYFITDQGHVHRTYVLTRRSHAPMSWLVGTRQGHLSVVSSKFQGHLCVVSTLWGPGTPICVVTRDQGPGTPKCG
jgi:hypothetical protein